MATAEALAGWEINEIAGLGGWFEALPPPATPAATRPAPGAAPRALVRQSLSPADCWDRVRQLRTTPGVEVAEPLFFFVNPHPTDAVDADRFALGYGQEQFGLWGWPYDEETLRAIADARQHHDWHLGQLRVREAWDAWKQRFPDPAQLPGDGILVGHPDTGYSDHPELRNHYQLPGRSFLLAADGSEEPDARDTLEIGGAFLENPGHGTATACVIASGEHDLGDASTEEAYGVAPGARVLPLRVSRSVIHFDFSNVGHAILHAVDAGVDVISMSLGGPTYSEFLRACVAKAHAEGVIVVAAAGNSLPATVFPAAFPEVVAVAATNAARSPWRFSGLGRLVDIAAPGEEVWCARTALENGAPAYSEQAGTGTSFATACVAGLAVLWLSYHGGRAAIAEDQYGGERSLVPFAFQYALARSANGTFDFVRGGRYGAGIADAASLLAEPLPSRDEVERFKAVVENQPVTRLTFVTGLLSGGMAIDDAGSITLAVQATVEDTPDGRRLRDEPLEETAAVRAATREREAERQLLARLIGESSDDLGDELLARVAADRTLLVGLQRWRQGESVLPLLDRLLGVSATGGAAVADGAAVAADSGALSAPLRARLEQQRAAEVRWLERLHRGRLGPGVAQPVYRVTPQGVALDRAAAEGLAADGPVVPPPPYRPLRAYAFDPSLDTTLATAPITQVTIPVRWEPLLPGPVGEYLEVVDVDPASGCAYAPVDLDHPHILAQNGLPPSEGQPQFHQQMVYAVAMNTLHRFELALGRPIFWAPLRPWLGDPPEERHTFTPEALRLLGYGPDKRRLPPREAQRDRYVQRLRVYPHALREPNAYYSPKKRAIVFGYFPATDDDTGRHYPGGMVFTCLSHDIVAHETTHALVDGMHPYFKEPSNEDVWAFHEAFADMMALFQHFTYPEVLRHQIANTRGALDTNNLLAQLAQQFGEATGRRGALRDYLGREDPETHQWQRLSPDAKALRSRHEPHERGGVLIAAVFDAFLALYNERVADLLRIYTGGTGVLPAGAIHPDLVNRLAIEAAATAEEVLRTCIRALDYVPPVDVTFGEFLRALVTAGYDVAPTEGRHTRVAFIEAFRSWGIYPRDVATLSEESLRWHQPRQGDPLVNLFQTDGFTAEDAEVLTRLARTLDEWQPVAAGDRPDRGDRGYGASGPTRSGPGEYRDARGEVFRHVLNAQQQLHSLFQRLQRRRPADHPLLLGIDLRHGARFTIGNLRPARRIGPQGEFRTEMVFEVVQTYRPLGAAGDAAGSARPAALPLRGGATLIVDLRTGDVRYVIHKRLYERLPDEPGPGGVLSDRLRRQAADAAGLFSLDVGNLQEWLAATYACEQRSADKKKLAIRDEPFALLHRSFSWFVPGADRLASARSAANEEVTSGGAA